MIDGMPVRNGEQDYKRSFHRNTSIPLVNSLSEKGLVLGFRH